MNRFFIDFGSILAPKIGLKWLQKTFKKRIQKSKEISLKIIKNSSKIGAQGGSNEPAFRSLDLLGNTQPPKGTPHSHCSRGGPGRPNGCQGAAKWSQNGTKIDPKGSQMEAKLNPKGSKRRENGVPSEQKLIKQSVKNKAVECYSFHALKRTLWRK